jgi:hypothetical protein
LHVFGGGNRCDRAALASGHLGRAAMQTILIGLGIVILAGVLLAMAFRPGRVTPMHFTDADSDGEPDETPEEKRRGLEDEP